MPKKQGSFFVTNFNPQKNRRLGKKKWSQQIIRNSPTFIPISFPTVIRDGILWRIPCKRRRSLKRNLEIAVAERRALGRSWQSPPYPSSIHQVESIGAIATILPKTSGHKLRHTIFAIAVFSYLNERAVLPNHTVDPKYLLTQKLIVSLQNFSATIQKPPR